MAPGSLLYYIGIDRKLDNVLHHSLFFDVPFEAHARDIYVTEQWPKEPLFYLSVSSVTDPLAAPEGCENLVFVLSEIHAAHRTRIDVPFVQQLATERLAAVR